MSISQTLIGILCIACLGLSGCAKSGGPSPSPSASASSDLKAMQEDTGIEFDVPPGFEVYPGDNGQMVMRKGLQFVFVAVGDDMEVTFQKALDEIKGTDEVLKFDGQPNTQDYKGLPAKIQTGVTQGKMTMPFIVAVYKNKKVLRLMSSGPGAVQNPEIKKVYESVRKRY